DISRVPFWFPPTPSFACCTWFLQLYKGYPLVARLGGKRTELPLPTLPAYLLVSLLCPLGHWPPFSCYSDPFSPSAHFGLLPPQTHSPLAIVCSLKSCAPRSVFTALRRYQVEACTHHTSLSHPRLRALTTA